MTFAAIEIITADIKFPSPYTHRVQILCHEKNISYRLNPINIFQKPDQSMLFLRVSP